MRLNEFSNDKKNLDEVSLGDYRNKALKQKAQSQMNIMFARSPEEREKNAATFYKRERGLNRLKARDDAARKTQQEKQLAADIAALPELKAEYESMKAEYKKLGGSNWQYADREQNLTDYERKARSMEGPMNNLWRKIQAAEKAKPVAEAVSQGNYNVGLEDIGKPVLVGGEQGYVLLHIGYDNGSGKLVAKVLQPDTGANGYYDLKNISRVLQGVAEAGNKPLEKSRFGTGDTRTPRDIKSQMQGASDEFVKSTADKKTGPFHSKVAKMQGKMAKSELRRRDHSVAEGTDPNTQSHADAFKSETDTMKPGTTKYVGRKGGKEVTAKKDEQGNVKFYHRDGIKGPLKRVTEGSESSVKILYTGKDKGGTVTISYEPDYIPGHSEKYIIRFDGRVKSEMPSLRSAVYALTHYQFDTFRPDLQPNPKTAVEQGVAEGYTVTRGIDKERYQERPGLEGPFSTKSGKVVYYDKVEGKYYDPETDFYIEYDDWRAMNEAGGDVISFELSNERAYNHVMQKFGNFIDWQDEAMTIPRKYWDAVQELALSAGGEAVEYGTLDEVSDTLRNRYVARASDDYGMSNFAARASKGHPGLEDYSKEQEARAKKRAAGLGRALSDKRTGRISETTGVTDYNPKSQGGTRAELLAKFAKSKSSEDATAARKAGATQTELRAARDAEPVKESRGRSALRQAMESVDANQKKAKQVPGSEMPKKTSPVIGKEEKQHPFKGRAVGGSI